MVANTGVQLLLWYAVLFRFNYPVIALWRYDSIYVLMVMNVLTTSGSRVVL